ncbi:chemotaxis protein CheW [Leptolyngbya sp. FACHB-671]|uniref:chemotaxis protein CheW n=1 Tax=Leptolyngbya sp. FACHB-671 TaxID=2692812 RepID=UPI001683BA38|nr:chemotaxis protein CheW [Leptolyngbya sp. FACHB-671]MBD1868938.1 chemotaxis protein CheW [Cyanobacteria bacterium FACHB-471]MBD2070532.1 chemotaxis protein CheW [Leptolyngbya sp. FACHB-671]
MIDAAAEGLMQGETELTTSPSLQDRYILTQVGDQQFAFPSVCVAEILLIERSQILALPFYDAAILGVVHNHGRIVPLVEIQRLFKKTSGLMRETVNVVQLSQETEHLAGIGIVVDQILDNRSPGQLPDDMLSVAASKLSGTVSPPVQGSIQLFRPELLSDRLWTPQYWH